jgi:predicted metal-dependent HD superfamily phosphohydrolase
MTPALEAAYAEPHRRYHTREHIEECLAELAGIDGLSPDERALLEWGIWWHDAIYDPARTDNEERSAEMADRDLAAMGARAEDRREVVRLIRLTKGHEVSAGDRLGALLVSIDLSILAAEPARYDSYARAVREEYAHVPDAAFRAGRTAVLQRFVESAVLFPDPTLSARWEARARANLERELATLRA